MGMAHIVSVAGLEAFRALKSIGLPPTPYPGKKTGTFPPYPGHWTELSTFHLN